MRCFNSSMVRLGARSAFYHNAILEFQFQYGAIGSHHFCSKCLSRQVSIPVWCDWEQSIQMVTFCVLCFNSSMVRLEVLIICCFACSFNRFNSSMVRLGGYHTSSSLLNATVSIPVWCDWEAAVAPTTTLSSCFNSSMVRLGVWIVIMTLFPISCFNSSMVRLGECKYLQLN